MADILTNDELRKLATNPKEALKDSSLRGKALGMPADELKGKLKEFSRRNNLDPSASITEIVTEIIKVVG